MTKRKSPQRKTNEPKDEVDKVTFRLWPPYSTRIVELSKAARVQPNQFARLATMAMVDGGFLDLSEKMKRLEGAIISFRRDFNEVVHDRESDE